MAKRASATGMFSSYAGTLSGIADVLREAGYATEANAALRLAKRLDTLAGESEPKT